jgi:hypothetical protein
LRNFYVQVDDLERELESRNASSAHIAVQDLQRQLHQVSQLLAERQAQWEHAAAEKAARIITLERQLNQANDKVALRARLDHGDQLSRRVMLVADDVVPMEALGAYYHSFASNRRVGGAVKVCLSMV